MRDFLPLFSRNVLKAKSAFWFVCLALNLFSVPFPWGSLLLAWGSFVLSEMSDGALASARAGEEWDRCGGNEAAAGLMHGHSAGR